MIRATIRPPAAPAAPAAPLTGGGGAIPRIRLEMVGVSMRRMRKVKRTLNAIDALISSDEIILRIERVFTRNGTSSRIPCEKAGLFVEYWKESRKV